ncbi:hypothetical protein AK812_SmicGene27146 [Symbiodinium microadriaticum]|uniref:Uncharacterized protein n=1 Tax=Symbiodinium microadriaticum TaxID=2951 RepID=A0A1Q9D7Q7_SYMMI|nr:hypothetical protein AK812_SmicGene27146 [Symbiodinium microadriaticum]
MLRASSAIFSFVVNGKVGVEWVKDEEEGAEHEQEQEQEEQEEHEEQEVSSCAYSVRSDDSGASEECALYKSRPMYTPTVELLKLPRLYGRVSTNVRQKLSSVCSHGIWIFVRLGSKEVAALGYGHPHHQENDARQRAIRIAEKALAYAQHTKALAPTAGADDTGLIAHSDARILELAEAYLQ